MTQKFDFALIATLSHLKVEKGQKQNPYNNATLLIATTSLLGAKQINLFK